MRDDGDDEKRPKLFWIRMNPGDLGNVRDGPQSGRRAVRGTRAAGRRSVGTRKAVKTYFLPLRKPSSTFVRLRRHSEFLRIPRHFTP